MKSFFVRKFNWLWICSIILFLLGVIISTLFEDVISVEDNPILGEISSLPGWLFLILAVVIAPIMEEFSFRFWAVKKLWAKFFSLITSSLFLYFINPYFAIPYFVLYLLSILIFKNKKDTLFATLSILTSLGFMLAHSQNLETSIFIKSAPIYTSIGLMLSYIAIRTKFLYAIFSHAIYNFSLLLIGGLILPFGSEVQINNGDYQGVLKPVTGLYSTSNTDNYGGYSVNLHRKMLPELISILNFDSPYEIKTYPKTYNFYNLNVKTTQKDSIIDLQAISRELIEKTSIKIDTIIEEGMVYHLEIKDIDKFKSQHSRLSINDENQRFNELGAFIINIFFSKDIKINTPDKYKALQIKDITDKELSQIIDEKSKEEIISFLDKEYGIILNPNMEKVKVIRIIEE
ncbi:MAG: CPBP family intramembrane metalloprotease [Bacteroidales bacterium]|nr:CPBP family intramembrane metalloprotease [Bacteroidales bacterium]